MEDPMAAVSDFILEIFARGKRHGWDVFGNQADDYNIKWDTYANNSKIIKPKQSKILELSLKEPFKALRKIK